MDLKVYQVDAWREPSGDWTYNDSIPICKVSVRGEPTTRKILKALRDKGLLRDKSIYQVDDYLSYEGSWEVQLIRNWMPLYNLKEIKEM